MRVIYLVTQNSSTTFEIAVTVLMLFQLNPWSGLGYKLLTWVMGMCSFGTGGQSFRREH